MRSATATDFFSKVKWTNLFFMSVGYSTALRGEEIIKTDLYNLKVHTDDALEHHMPYEPIPLLQKVKGETGTRHHVIPIAAQTKTGLRRISFLCKQGGLEIGCLLLDDKHKQVRAIELENVFRMVLEFVQSETKLISQDLPARDEYGIHSWLRRGYAIHPINSGVKE